MLRRLSAEGVGLALHGRDHRTRSASPRRHSELCGLSHAQTEQLLTDALGELAPHGIDPWVFVPPYNRFDADQLELIARRFRVVCGGPESIGTFGFHSSPQWRGQAVYLPSYAPLYGTAAEVLPAIERAIERGDGLWLPVVLHWGWSWTPAGASSNAWPSASPRTPPPGRTSSTPSSAAAAMLPGRRRPRRARPRDERARAGAAARALPARRRRARLADHPRRLRAGRAGAARAVPRAELFTSVYDPSPWPAQIKERVVHSSFLDRIPGAVRHYPKLLPLMDRAFRSFDLSRFDLVLSSSHACAKNVRTPPHTLHVCYCHTPMRYAWEEGFLDGEQVGRPTRLLLPPLLVGCAARIWPAPPAPTCSSPTPAMSPSASSATTGAPPRSSTRRSTSSTSSACHGSRATTTSPSGAWCPTSASTSPSPPARASAGP